MYILNRKVENAEGIRTCARIVAFDVVLERVNVLLSRVGSRKSFKSLEEV